MLTETDNATSARTHILQYDQGAFSSWSDGRNKPRMHLSYLDQEIELFRATLNHAINNAPYYAKEKYKKIAPIESYSDVLRLPIITRSDFVANAFNMLTTNEMPKYFGNTSGTTYNSPTRSPLIYMRDDDERDSMACLYDGISASGQRPMMLRIITPDHGEDISAGSTGVISAPLEKSYHVNLIVELLRKSYEFEGFANRIQILSGSVNQIKALTAYLYEHGYSSESFDIKLISVGSWSLTERWKVILERFWGCKVVDVYGVSEVLGLAASRCSDCGGFRFQRSAFLEFLDLSESKPPEGNTARLVVTTLFPLVRTQPLIRYDTGDIFSSKKGCDAVVTPCLNYLGRKKDIIFDDETGQVMISPIHVHEIIDAFPEVASVQNGRAKEIGVKQMLGWKKYKVEENSLNGVQSVSIQIEATFSPMQYQDRAEALKTNIKREILLLSPVLRERVNQCQVAFDVSILGPGTTDAESAI